MFRILRWLSIPCAAVLLAVSGRRLLFTWVAMRHNPPRDLRLPARAQPQVLILVACRDEASLLPELIESLSRLRYPPERLQVALVDDGSIDGTHSIARGLICNLPAWRVIRHPTSVGKAQALNTALEEIAFGEIVAVYDADHRPAPDALSRLVAAFDDPMVAGASGRTIPINSTASLFAYYASVEGLVHQRITMQAKDHLNLAPALLGSNCAYRRAALLGAGGFRPGALLEDSDLTLTLARLGYRLRFVPESIAWHQVPETRDGFMAQHARWARGFHDVARDHWRAVLLDPRLPLRLRLELAMFALGYLDRVALLGTLAAAATARPGRLRTVLAAVTAMALAAPVVSSLAAFALQRLPGAMWLRLPAIPLLYALDVWVAVRSAAASLANRPRNWERMPRASVHRGADRWIFR